MKGGAALALVGALILALGLKGTWKDVYQAAIGQYHGVTGSGATGQSLGDNTTNAPVGAIIGCRSNGPVDAVSPPSNGKCPDGYTPIYKNAGGSGGAFPYIRGLSPGSALPTYAGSGVRQNGFV